MGAEISMMLDNRRAKKDEVYPVKLRVYYEARTTLCPTVFDLTQADYDKLDAKRASERIMEIRGKPDGLVKDAQRLADTISPFDFGKFFIRFVYENPLFEQKKRKVEKISSAISGEEVPPEWTKRFSLLKEEHPYPNAISVIYREIILNLLRQKQIGTAISYHDSWKSFQSFRSNVRINEVTSAYLFEYEEWMLARKRSITTVGMYTRSLRAVYKKGIRKKFVTTDQYPFSREEYLIPTGKNVKKAIDKSSIAKLYATAIEKEHQEKARDYWFFIYYGNGMNVQDFVLLKNKNIMGEYLVFHRAKTSRTSRGCDPVIITCVITPDMWRIIKKWGNESNNPDDYLFPVLTSEMSAIEQYEAKRNCIRFINKNMARVSLAEQLARKPKTK
jgi:hypothetical protein